jgi:sulfhydrogenase subunit delta
MKKLNIAIFDLTDCEGCELQFLSLRKKLLKRGKDFKITNWRLVNRVNDLGPFDVTFVEGSVITEADAEILKQTRKMSKMIIALGSCAALGGVQSALSEKDRPQNLCDIYDLNYKTTSKHPRPISYFIDVDSTIHGCPVNEEELERLLSCLFAGKKYTPKQHTVCFDCKAAGNPCLFLDEGFCLGPVTRGGCKAPCPSNGLGALVALDR